MKTLRSIPVRLSGEILYRLLWPFAVGAVITWASGHVHAPQLPDFDWLPRYDKLAHLLYFGLLATLICRYRPELALNGRQAIFAIVMTSVFGMADELNQFANPVRFFEVADWIYDTIGAVLAVVVYQRWKAYRDLLEYDLRAPFRRWRRGGLTNALG